MNTKVVTVVSAMIVGTAFGVGIVGLALKDDYEIARCTLSELGSVVYMETNGFVSPNYSEYQKAAKEFHSCAANSFDDRFDTKTMLKPVEFR